MSNATRLMVITNEHGDIVGTAGVSEKGAACGVKALPGQSIHTLDLPEEFFRHATAVERHKFLSAHRVLNDRIVKK